MILIRFEMQEMHGHDYHHDWYHHLLRPHFFTHVSELTLDPIGDAEDA